MAITDKHPPLDPNRHSTNKRVKPLGENIFGTPVLTAEGSKRVKPGDPNSTSADFMGPGESQMAEQRREEEERLRIWREGLAGKESFLSEARGKLMKRGWMTQHESEALKIMRGKSNQT